MIMITARWLSDKKRRPTPCMATVRGLQYTEWESHDLLPNVLHELIHDTWLKIHDCIISHVANTLARIVKKFLSTWLKNQPWQEQYPPACLTQAPRQPKLRQPNKPSAMQLASTVVIMMMIMITRKSSNTCIIEMKGDFNMLQVKCLGCSVHCT